MLKHLHEHSRADKGPAKAPEVHEMGGEDVVVLCGEWEIGKFSAEESGEIYNIELPVLEIRRHPNFKINRGNNTSQYVENDIETTEE